MKILPLISEIRLTCLLAATASILSLSGAGAARPAKSRAGSPVARSLSGSEIEDSTKTGAVGLGATGPRVVRAQILLDRARFSPGEIDGVYGDDFGIAVKGYQENHGLSPTGKSMRKCGVCSIATPVLFC